MQTVPPDELVRWCQRALPDDPRPFEQLVALYKDRVYRTAYRMMGNAQEAEDQAQEVFLKIYKGIKTLAEPVTVTAWIYQITTTTCLDALDKRRRRPATQPLVPPESDQTSEPTYADPRAETPEVAALRRELRDCLATTLASLDRDGRVVLVLRDLEGRSYQEIADLLQVGLSAVKMRIHRARLAFQHLFDRLCPNLRRLEGIETSAQ